MTRQPRILIVATSADRLPGGEPTGLWLEELTTPLYALEDAGAEVVVASVAGGPIPVDARSIAPEGENDASVERYNRDPAARAEEILRDGALSAHEVKVDRRTADTLGASIDFKSTVAMLNAVRGLESAGFGIARLTVEPAAGGRHPGSVNASLELVVP